MPTEEELLEGAVFETEEELLAGAEFEAPVEAPPPAQQPGGFREMGARLPPPGTEAAVAYGGPEGVLFGHSGEVAGLGASASDFLSGRLPTPRTTERGLDAPIDPRSEYQVGRDEFDRERMQAQERAPGGYLAGEILGGISTAPLTGGVAGRAVKAAAPAIAKAAPRLAPAITEGVGVGMLEGAGRSEAEFGEAEFGQDVLMGGAVGAAVPTAMQAPSAARFLGGKAAAIPGQISRAVHAPRLPAPARETARKLTAVGPEGAAAREVMDVGQREEQAAIRDLTQHATTVKKAAEDVSKALNVSMKPAAFVRAFEVDPPPMSPDAILDAADGPLMAFRAISEDIEQHMARFEPGTGARGRQLTRVLDEFETDLLQGVEQGGPQGMAQMHVALDKIKRMAGKLQKRTKDQTIRADVRDAYEQMRVMLEDPTIWGNTATAKQQRMNVAYTEWLTAEDAQFSRKFMTKDPRARSPVDPFEAAYRGDPAAIKGMLDKAGTEEGEGIVDLFSAGIETEGRLARVLTEEYGDAVPAVLKQQAMDAGVAADRIGDIVSERVRQGQARMEGQFLREELGSRGRLVPDPLTVSGAMRAVESFGDSNRGILGDMAQQASTPQAQQSARRILEAWQTPGIAGAVEQYKTQETDPEFRLEIQERKDAR